MIDGRVKMPVGEREKGYESKRSRDNTEVHEAIRNCVLPSTRALALKQCNYTNRNEQNGAQQSCERQPPHAYPLSSGAILCNMSANTELGHDAAYP